MTRQHIGHLRRECTPEDTHASADSVCHEQDCAGASRRVVYGTGTYMDGAEYYGAAEFEAEHGVTFAEFTRQNEAETVPAEYAGRLYRDHDAR